MHDSSFPTGPDSTDDRELIRRYAETGSEEAFGVLMHRHLDRVYSVCRRDLRDTALAEDATQVVFLLLARKARSLRKVECLGGWLFQTARLVCRNLRRQQARRRQVELPLEPDGEAGRLVYLPDEEPLLLDALDALRPKDLNAILLRFFEEREFAEIGNLLGISEDAARMRVNRALGKMRVYLTARGVRHDSEAAVGATLAPTVFLVPGSAACKTTIAGLARTVTLADALSHLPTDNLLRATFEGVIRTMHFQTLRPVVATVAVTGVITTLLIGMGNLRAASVPTAVQVQPPIQVKAEANPEEMRQVLMKFRLIERLTEESGATKDSVLNAPILTTMNNRSGMIKLSTGAPNADETQWAVEAVPQLNADGTISVRLTYSNEEKVTAAPGDGEVEETVKEHKITSKLRMKSGKPTRLSLIKGAHSEFFLEIVVSEIKPNSGAQGGNP